MTKTVLRNVVSMIALRDAHGIPTEMRIYYPGEEISFPITHTFEWIHDDVSLESYVIVRD